MAEADDDFLVFDLGNGNQTEGIVRSVQDDTNREPTVSRFVRSANGFAKVEHDSGSSTSLRSRAKKAADSTPALNETAEVTETGREQPGDTTGSLTSRATSLHTAGSTVDVTVPGAGGVDSRGSDTRKVSENQYYQNAAGEIVQSGQPENNGIQNDGWTTMETVGPSEMYNDKGEQVVKLQEEIHTQTDNAAASGYTRVIVDEDAKSITSLDEKTDHLFDAEADVTQQVQATKDMLSENQRIAYTALCRVIMADMEADMRRFVNGDPLDSLQLWASKVIHRLYAHLDLSNEEQIMIEQLSHHGVLAEDLTPSLRIDQTVLPSGDIIEEAAPRKELQGEDLNADVEHDAAMLPKKNQELKIDVRWTVLCDLFLNLVVDSVYDSRSRTLLEKFASALGVTALDICQFERKITDAMQIDDGGAQTWEEGEIIEDRRKRTLRKKYAYIGLATIGGGLVIGLSAGLLAPVIGAGIAAGFTTIGIGGTGTFLAGAGGAALVTTTGVAVGAHVGRNGMTRRMGHVKTFEFRPVHNKSRVNLVITVSGWMNGKEDDVRLPYSTIDPVVGDLLSVYWEPEMMQSMGQTINILATEALTQSVQQILGATVLTALMASIQLPMALSKLSYLLDNPWNVSLDRAWSAGLILADSLIARNLGSRPTTLVGFSLGARVIYSCLVELSRRGAYGLVQDVLIFGAPVAFNKRDFRGARSVVSGRFLNGYSTKDWILGYLFRATSGGLSSVLGLAPIKADDIEDMDVTELVEGHMAYRRAMPKLLAMAGWPVLSDEFDEVNDPDPTSLRDKQRKLIAELQNENDRKPNKFASFFGFGKRNKEWLSRAKSSEKEKEELEKPVDPDAPYPGEDMFDLDALQAEVGRLEKLEPQMIFDINQELDKDAPPEYEAPNLPKSPRSPGKAKAEKPAEPPSRLARHHHAKFKSVSSVQSNASVEMTFDNSLGSAEDAEPERVEVQSAAVGGAEELADLQPPSEPHASSTSLRSRRNQQEDADEITMSFA